MAVFVCKKRYGGENCVQCFDAHSNQKKEENIQFTNFNNTFNISKPFELAQGKFMDIGMWL